MVCPLLFKIVDLINLVSEADLIRLKLMGRKCFRVKVTYMSGGQVRDLTRLTS